MEVLRQNKLIAGILGGLVLMALLVVLLNNDDSSSEGTPASPESTSGTATATAAVTTQFERPNVEMLDCLTLLDSDDIDAALATSGGWATISRGETCTHDLLGNSQTFVRIEPGGPSDFTAGAERLGVTGQPVSEVGDLALWFGGPDAEGGGSVGALIVATEAELGALVYRIVIGRPDLTSSAQLEIAKTLALAALPRFPGIAIEPPPPPDPVIVTVEHEPPDQSDQGYVANLLAREAAGEWTRGEGLLATLQLLVGETTASRVTPARTIADQSATGIVRLARSFLETNGDDAEAAEIERLLDLLIPQAPATFDATAGAARSPLQRTSPQPIALQPIALQTSQEPPDGCYPAWPDHGDPCFMWSPADEQYGNKYLLWYPDLDEWEGWTRGPSTVRDAMRRTVNVLEDLEGETPPIYVWLGPYAGHSVVEFSDDSVCNVVLSKGAQALRDQDPALLQQAVASAMARCYIDPNFGLPEAWESPIAWYLSDVAYPGASMETLVLKVPDTLRDEELRSTLLERSLSNMTFFEYLDLARGLDGAMAAVGAIADAGPGAIEDVDQLLHDYEKALTDGVIADQDGAHPFVPGADRYDLTPGLRIKTQPRAFGLARVQVTVPAGMHACIEYPDALNLDLIVSWRPGEPGEGGTWSTDLPPDLEGTAVFLITVGEADGAFDLVVTDVDDDPNCDDEGQSPDVSDLGPPCGFCDPTEFFWNWVIPGLN